ncbi:MAG TPA: LPXTG cell wall anchor domain-containing protein [Bryobacteraceae bacterium]|nr:LPXTG cell wall anchor domain-containing protein [Bryobacteraceae bacterium]
MTKALKLVLAVLCVGVLFAVLPATADSWNKLTTVTFSAPVQLPGMTLPAGTYVFKLLDSPSDRHIVQVFNEDQDHLYTTILAIPNYRLTPTDKTVLNFTEAAPGKPVGVRAWFYPGDNFGQEFVYPKAEATEIAAATNQPVPAAEIKPAETPQELVQEPVTTVTPENKEVAEAPAPAPTPAPVAEAPVAVTPAPAPELPKTASPVPLAGLLGLASLGLSGLLRVVRRRS